MRKIRQINVGGITGSGEQINYQVDVFGLPHASDEIFNGAGIAPANQQPFRGDDAPTHEWKDATFSPQDWDITPKHHVGTLTTQNNHGPGSAARNFH
jgi:hypothetical protein